MGTLRFFGGQFGVPGKNKIPEVFKTYFPVGSGPETVKCFHGYFGNFNDDNALLRPENNGFVNVFTTSSQSTTATYIILNSESKLIAWNMPNLMGEPFLKDGAPVGRKVEVFDIDTLAPLVIGGGKGRVKNDRITKLVKWTLTKRTVAFPDGSKHALYKNPAMPGELRVRTMRLGRDGRRHAVYQLPPQRKGRAMRGGACPPFVNNNNSGPETMKICQDHPLQCTWVDNKVCNPVVHFSPGDEYSNEEMARMFSV